MDSATLYLDFFSPSSLSIAALLLFNQTPLQIQNIWKVKKDPTLFSEFQKINPEGTVPFLDDNGFCLNESHAILRYLCATKPIADEWYPKDPAKRALIDSYLEWHNTNTKKCSLYFQTYYAHVMPKAYFTWDAAEEKKNTIKALERLENYNLKNSKYIASDEHMTIADLSAVCEIIRVRATKINFDEFPRVKKWIDECMKHPQFQKANKAPLLLIERATNRLHL